jgi:hypothetical protein
MMDLYFREESLPVVDALPQRRGDVVEGCLAWMAEAHGGLAALLAAERAARETDPDFGEAYHAGLWVGTRDLATRQVDRAVRDLAALYQAAWEEAGRPPGPEAAPPFQALPPEALEASPERSRGLSRKGLVAAAAILAGALLIGSR